MVYCVVRPACRGLAILKTDFLPYPTLESGLKKRLKPIDSRLLNCSSRFISLQVKRPVTILQSNSFSHWPLNSPQANWLDIYSVYRSNQQLAEACNKVWACAELVNATSPSSGDKYEGIGEKFNQMFLGGTIVPTLYYSQISAMISSLTLCGCIPVLIDKRSLFLLRTRGGWIVRPRVEYIRNISGEKPRSWHEQIITTYFMLVKNGVELPPVSSSRLSRLKDSRNGMHYDVLGDLTMWRMTKAWTDVKNFFKLVMQTIDASLNNLENVSRVTTGCDERFRSLKERSLQESESHQNSIL